MKEATVFSSCRAADSRGLHAAQGFTVAGRQTGAGPFWTFQVRNRGHEPDAGAINMLQNPAYSPHVSPLSSKGTL